MKPLVIEFRKQPISIRMQSGWREVGDSINMLISSISRNNGIWLKKYMKRF